MVLPCSYRNWHLLIYFHRLHDEMELTGTPDSSHIKNKKLKSDDIIIIHDSDSSDSDDSDEIVIISDTESVDDDFKTEKEWIFALSLQKSRRKTDLRKQLLVNRLLSRVKRTFYTQKLRCIQ